MSDCNSATMPIPVVIGVDIGGTNTDVAVLHRKGDTPHVVADVKELTSSDVNTGVQKAVLRALLQARDKGVRVRPIQVNIGTTHFVNAVVQGKNLAKIAVIRICGPVSEELPPFCDFPTRLANIIRGSVHLVRGGCRFDGKEHEPLDEAQIRQVVRDIRTQGLANVAVIGVFSPIRPDQEKKARDLILDEFPEASVSLSHEIGHIGILERENATILNECLKPLCRRTVEGFSSALEDIGVGCPFYLTENDGTIISSSEVLKYPVFTFASGPTNSMRGASFLSERKDAVVVDIGGTTTDVGVLKGGFPREASSHVKVGGVRTNFRMPDVVSIGLGGGSYVRERKSPDGALVGVKVGPLSAGLNLKREAFVFAEDGGDLDGRSLTATDVAVAAGLCKLGYEERVKDVNSTLAEKSVEEIRTMLVDLVDKIKLRKESLPVIIVGGGSVLIDVAKPLKGATEVIVPKYFGVANAIGAALSKISVTSNVVTNLLDLINREEMEQAVSDVSKGDFDEQSLHEKDQALNKARKPFLDKARIQAIEKTTETAKASVIAKGGQRESLELFEKQDSVLSYIPGNVIEIKVKVVADLTEPSCSTDASGSASWLEPKEMREILSRESQFTGKQTVSSTGNRIDGTADDDTDVDARLHPQEPFIDSATGEWILNEWDIECIVVGAAIYGAGGGASAHMGRLRSLKKLREGKKMRVVTPERLLKNDEKQMVIGAAFIGAPLIMYEQGISSKETTKALECLRDIYGIGKFKDGTLQNNAGVDIETSDEGVKSITNYQPASQDRTEDIKAVGLMSMEIGGLNAVEPLLIAANMDWPILDCDGMSRAFPEVQMLIPLMYDKSPYPATVVGSGNLSSQTVLLHCSKNKQLENMLRDVSIANGCSAGFALSFTREEILTKTPLHTVSSAWRLGDAVLKARLEKESVIEAIVRQEDAKHVITGKIMDVQRETTGGFNRGFLTVEGLDEWKGREVRIEFQNENLVVLSLEEGVRGACLGCVPDLICVVDADTAETVQTEEVRYGLRVAVLLLPSHRLLRQPQALKWVGPQAFHYPDSVQFAPYKERRSVQPIPPF